ncbi:hypothetical protein M3Y99_00443600 [Aphelenchoides fujianensis]|nr:hypothetical protein M3Y99_00443600 [Aphelenchoides fujianensis]
MHLIEEQASWKTKFDQLWTEHEQLHAYHERLYAQHEHLHAQHDQLHAEHKELQDAYDDLHGAFDTKGKMNGFTTRVMAASYDELLVLHVKALQKLLQLSGHDEPPEKSKKIDEYRQHRMVLEEEEQNRSLYSSPALLSQWHAHRMADACVTYLVDDGEAFEDKWQQLREERRQQKRRWNAPLRIFSYRITHPKNMRSLCDHFFPSEMAPSGRNPPASSHRRLLLTEESARTLAAYHRLKQQWETNRANEGEILKLIDVADEARMKWKAAEIRRAAAEEQNGRLERARTNLEREIKAKEADFLSLQEESLGLRNKLLAYEQILADYEARMAGLRTIAEENLKNTAGYDKMMKLSRVSRPLPPISEATLSGHETPMDTEGTADDDEKVQLRYARKYRRSQSQEPGNRRTSHSKRPRASRHDAINEERENADPRVAPPSAKRSREAGREITVDATITLDEEGRTPTRASVEVRRHKKRSVSASRILDDKPSTARRQLQPRSPRLVSVVSSSDLRRTPTAFGSSWTAGRPIASCEHAFVPQKSSRLFSMLLTNSCACCNGAISSAAGVGMSCKECRINIHARCKGRAPMPCLPAAVFPAEAFSVKAKHNLADLCPTRPPFIPALVLRCVFALEQNRLNAEGIYRVVADKKAVDDLYAEFMKQKYIPDMSLQPTEVICGTLLKFLRFLKDPLVPRSSYREFIQAAACAEVGERERQLQEAIAELPLPNQDTLAFLAQHLQKVAHFASENRMPAENLARCFAPVLLSDRQSTLTNLGRAEAENERETAAVRALLEMPADFWSDYLDQRTATTAPAKFGTPLTHVLKAEPTTSGSPQTPRSRADRSVLGPVTYAPKNFTPRSRTPGRIPPALF